MMNVSPEATAALSDWLDAHTAGGPPALIARVREHAMAAPEGETLPERLSFAAERVLSIVEEHPGDREIALDLLSADALITLALLAQAELAPASLARFAAEVLAGERV